MQELLRPCYLDVDLAPRMKKLWWYPYAGNFAPLAAFVELVHSAGIRRRLRAALRALTAFARPRR
jgi:hypothetical protein